MSIFIPVSLSHFFSPALNHAHARKDGLIFKPEGFDLEAPKIGRIIQSLRSSEHLIILAPRLIVVALNLFQVPDVISPNTWYHKASKSAFLGQS